MKAVLLEHIWQLLIVAAILLFAATLYFIKRAKKHSAPKISAGRNRPRHPRPQNGRTKSSRFAAEEETVSSRTGLILVSIMVILTGWLAASILYPKADSTPETPLNNNLAVATVAPGSTFAKGSLSFLSPASQAANELVKNVRQANNPIVESATPAATPTEARAAADINTPQAQTASTATTNTPQTQATPSVTQAAPIKTTAQTQTPPVVATNTPPKPSTTSAPAEPSGLLSQNAAGQKPKTAANATKNTPANKPGTEAAKPTTTQNTAQNTNSILGAGREFTVHLSSFKNAKNAEDYKNKLSQAGSSPFIAETVQGGVTWYRVMSGRFSTRNEAMEHGLDLKRQGLTPPNEQFLIKPVN